MSEIVALLAVALLIAGVVGSLLPIVPSGLLSLAGVYVYAFWGSTEVGVLLLASFTVVGVVAAAFEHFAGAISARATGASTATMVYAAVAGLLLFFLTGPVGILIGVFGVVLLSELRGGANLPEAGRRAVFTLVGMLGSVVVEFLLTLSILVGFVLFVLVLG